MEFQKVSSSWLLPGQLLLYVQEFCGTLLSTSEVNGKSPKQCTPKKSLWRILEWLLIKFQGRLLLDKSRIRSSKTCVMASIILSNVTERKKKKANLIHPGLLEKVTLKDLYVGNVPFFFFFFFNIFCPPDGLL